MQANGWTLPNPHKWGKSHYQSNFKCNLQESTHPVLPRCLHSHYRFWDKAHERTDADDSPFLWAVRPSVLLKGSSSTKRFVATTTDSGTKHARGQMLVTAPTKFTCEHSDLVCLLLKGSSSTKKFVTPLQILGQRVQGNRCRWQLLWSLHVHIQKHTKSSTESSAVQKSQSSGSTKLAAVKWFVYLFFRIYIVHGFKEEESLENLCISSSFD